MTLRRHLLVGIPATSAWREPSCVFFLRCAHAERTSRTERCGTLHRTHDSCAKHTTTKPQVGHCIVHT